jgi:hypothetical protein
MEQHARIVLAIIAVNQHDKAAQTEAFERGARHAGVAADAVPSPTQLTLDALNDAVRRLSKCRFIERERLLEACALTAMADGAANDAEVLVVRAVADSLDVPVPALMPA